MSLRLICSLVHDTPEATVSIPPKQGPHQPREARLCDDAFAHVCDLLNDVSMPVRALAASLLGDFHSVSPRLLEQTLDKKLMSHLKVGCIFEFSNLEILLTGSKERSRAAEGTTCSRRRRVWFRYWPDVGHFHSKGDQPTSYLALSHSHVFTL